MNPTYHAAQGSATLVTAAQGGTASPTSSAAE